jgi:hypothetical protein
MIVAALIVSACGTQATTIPVPTQAPPTQAPPTQAPSTDIPTVEPTATFEPEVQVTRSEEILGAWKGNSQPVNIPFQLIFQENGLYSVKVTEGQYKGTTIDSGKYLFDGSNLNLQTSTKCENLQGDTFDCIGVYEVYITNQAGKPVQLRLIPIDDKYAGRKNDLTRLPLSIVITP